LSVTRLSDGKWGSAPFSSQNLVLSAAERWLADMSKNGFLILFLVRVWTIPHFAQ